MILIKKLREGYYVEGKGLCLQARGMRFVVEMRGKLWSVRKKGGSCCSGIKDFCLRRVQALAVQAFSLRVRLEGLRGLCLLEKREEVKMDSVEWDEYRKARNCYDAARQKQRKEFYKSTAAAKIKKRAAKARLLAQSLNKELRAAARENETPDMKLFREEAKRAYARFVEANKVVERELEEGDQK
jgi:hypothetical protein